MRLWMALGTALLTGGCFSMQTAVHPWLDQHDALAVPALAGTWLEEGDDEPTTLRIAPLDASAASEKGGPAYELTVLKKDRPAQGSLALTLGRLDGVLYWDLTPLPLSETADLWDAHVMGLHSLARLTVEGDRLEVAFLDPDWVKQALAEGALDAEHLVVDDVSLLTGETADLQRLVSEHAADDEAFGRPAVFARRPSAAE
jgi:hypothetical protein